MESKLKLYSLGIVVENKPQGSDFVLVTPIEDLNIQAPGKIAEHTKELKGGKKELEATQFTTEHEAKNYLKAKWFPYGQSNRISAPDVVKNETILLFKYENVDEYYWITIFREPELRRLEDVLYAFSNLRSGIKAFDRTSSYWMQVNTKNKFVHLHTSNNDGEACTYDIKIDTKAGVLDVKDSLGNSIQFRSTAGVVHLKAKNELILEAPKITHKASSQVTHDTPLVKNTGNVYTSGVDTAHPNANAVC